MRYMKYVGISVLISCGILVLGQAAAVHSAPPPDVPPVPSAALSAPHAGFAVEMPGDIQHRASCVIQIDSSGTAYSSSIHMPGRSDYIAVGRGSRFDAAMAAWLLGTTTLTEPAAQAVLDQKPGTVGRQVFIAAEAYGERFVRLEVALKKSDKPWPDNAADKLLGDLVERLRGAANESQKAEKAAITARLKTLAEQLAAAEARCKEIGESRRSVEAILGADGGYGGDSLSILRNLRSQVRSAETELAQLKARLESLENGPLEHHEKKVKAAEEKLAKVMESVKEGTATTEQVAEAAAELARAKETLAASRASSSSSERNRILSVREADSLRSDIETREARLAPLKEQLAKLEAPDMAAKLATYRNQEQEEQRLHSEIWSLKDGIRTLQNAVREQNSVTITVLAGEGAAKDTR